jgi:hypothetical protein
MKEAWKWQRDGSSTSTGFIIWKGPLQKETPVRQIEPTAVYRLGVDTGEKSGRETLLGEKILLKWTTSQPSLEETRGHKW